MSAKKLPKRGNKNPSEEYFTKKLKLKRLHIRLPAEDHDHLKKMADAADMDMREYISDLIREKWIIFEAENG